ncbi:helix-turn-helix transcriptional regulator [Marivivens donghaensis]|uniref:helix-turn-helix transcriptional regulator n=1 Tax=Marivivens donghaensis TaxID=1699413 RepID=UPI003F69F419
MAIGNLLITGKHCRAARAGLGLTQADFAKRCRVATRTIVHFEAEVRNPHALTLDAIEKVLLDAGVEFSERGVFIPIPSEP